MEIRQLKTFQMVGRLLSFNRAAKNLNYATSTVSSQIKLLEEEFGSPLFDRIGKSIRLTSTGQLLMQYSQKMLELEKETIASLSACEEPYGTISIRIPQSIGTYLLPTILSNYQNKFPKIGFDISTCAYNTLIHELKSGIVDLAFLLAESIPFSELNTEFLTIEPLVIVSSTNHPLTRKLKFDIKDLSGQTILLPKHDCSYKMVFEQLLIEKKIKNTVFIEFNSIEAIKECVYKNIGVAMMPFMAIEKDIQKKKLTVLKWPEEELESAILMIWHKDKWLSPTLKAFMGEVREVIGNS